MINRYNYLLFQVIKRTYLEENLLFPLVQIINIYTVTFHIHFFNFPMVLPCLSQIGLLALFISVTSLDMNMLGKF